MEMEALVKQMLERLGEDPDREGLVKTPHRVAKAWEFLTRGYHQTVEEIVNGATHPANCRRADGCSSAGGRWRRRRGTAFVHDDARCREAELLPADLSRTWQLPRLALHPHRVLQTA